jgi:hypothetical protein
MKRLINYLLNIGDCLSQLINNAVFMADNPNQSISGRCWQQRHDRYWRHLYSAVNFVASPWQENHCLEAYLADLDRARKMLEKKVC